MTQIVSHLASSVFAPRRSASTSLGKMVSLARQRQQLKDLDAHLLADLGISADDARREAARSFWDVPAYWRG